jgi:hypothetical protein
MKKLKYLLLLMGQIMSLLRLEICFAVLNCIVIVSEIILIIIHLQTANGISVRTS